VPAYVNTKDTWYTVYIPVHGLTSLRSLGIRQRDWAIGGGNEQFVHWYMDNIRWAQQSELDRALEYASSVTAFVPPNYASTQRTVALQSGQDLHDLRRNPKKLTARPTEGSPEGGSGGVEGELRAG